MDDHHHPALITGATPVLLSSADSSDHLDMSDLQPISVHSSGMIFSRLTVSAHTMLFRAIGLADRFSGLLVPFNALQLLIPCIIPMDNIMRKAITTTVQVPNFTLTVSYREGIILLRHYFKQQEYRYDYKQ